MKSAMVSALLALTVSACTMQQAQDGMDDPDACGASRLQHLVGKPVAGFDQAAVKGPLRIIGPDMGVTMDYNPDRLNILHDRKKIVESVTCG